MASTDRRRTRHRRALGRRERGMTAIGWIIVLALIAFFVLLALRLGPAYMEYFTVSSSMDSLAQEPGLGAKTPRQIRELLFKRFQINDVKHVERGDVEIYKEGAGVRVAAAYEVRVPVMGNVDAVLSFDKEVRIR